jgi:tetratricopeptide (TPR) repeat protein
MDLDKLVHVVCCVIGPPHDRARRRRRKPLTHQFRMLFLCERIPGAMGSWSCARALARRALHGSARDDAGAPPESWRDPDVLLLRAALQTHRGQPTEAEEACKRLLNVDELSADYVLALCREGAGDRTSAVSHDQVAIYLDPSFAMPHLHLGLLARRTADWATAQRDLGHALLLLQREDSSRLLLSGDGFGRETLVALCRTELLSCGKTP